MISPRRWRNLLFTVVLFGPSIGATTTLLAQPAAADAYSMNYIIHSQPGDPLSPISFVVTLNLTNVMTDASSIAWRVDELIITQPGAGNEPDKIWVRPFPELLTVDGLWWTDHLDPANPTTAEFATAPMIEGIATPIDEYDADLYYAFLSNPPVPSGGESYDNPVATTYVFGIVGAVEPEDEGDDEPSESDGTQDP